MFLPCAAQRSTTSSVAIMVVAMPCTGVSDDPVSRLSTVCGNHGTPTCFLMRVMTSPAVSAGAATVWPNATLTPAAGLRRQTLGVKDFP